MFWHCAVKPEVKASMNDQITEIIDKLYANARHFLKDDDIFDAIADTDLSPTDVNRIISRLQSMGVFIGDNIQLAAKKKEKVVSTTKKSPDIATTFEMLNIPVGTELYFSLDNSIKAITIDNKNKIRLAQDDKTYSLSGAARMLNVQLGRANSPRRGPDYWILEGQTLCDLRNNLQNNKE